jgi:hypothetical protein
VRALNRHCFITELDQALAAIRKHDQEERIVEMLKKEEETNPFAGSKSMSSLRCVKNWQPSEKSWSCSK